jgi:hypothetical protein
MNNSLCFVVVPSGRQPDGTGRLIDFDALYGSVIAPALAGAGLEPLRADVPSEGLLPKAVLERLVFCACAVVDVSTARAGAFHALGLRQGLRPTGTVALSTGLPDTLAYAVDEAGAPTDAGGVRRRLEEQLRNVRGMGSALFPLVDENLPNLVAHEKTDVFRDQVRYAEGALRAFEAARKQGKGAAVEEVLKGLGPLEALEAGVLIDAMLSFRAVKAWNEMVAFIDRLPLPLRETLMVREQRAFGLNRAGRGEEAEALLRAIDAERGPSSETLALLGRVYKDRWDAALKARGEAEARPLLDQAIDAYLRGFEADHRDTLPGINTVTLMELREPPDPRREALLPVVRYAVTRKMALRGADYWDRATLMELAVLAKDEAAAREALGQALAVIREVWEPETTQRNLGLIRKVRARRGETVPWAEDLERTLRERAGLGSTLG